MALSTIFINWEQQLKALDASFEVRTENLSSQWHSGARVAVKSEKLSFAFTYSDFPGGCGVCIMYRYHFEGDQELFVKAMDIFATLVSKIDTSGGLVACNPIGAREFNFLKLAGFTPMFTWNNTRHGANWGATLWFRICDDSNQPLKKIPIEVSYKLVDNKESLITTLLKKEPNLIKMQS